VTVAWFESYRDAHLNIGRWLHSSLLEQPRHPTADRSEEEIVDTDTVDMGSPSQQIERLAENQNPPIAADRPV
jgi:hypothetical protein